MRSAIRLRVASACVSIFCLLTVARTTAHPLDQWEKLKHDSFLKLDRLLTDITNGSGTNTTFLPKIPPTRIFDRKDRLIAEYLPVQNLLVPLNRITNNLSGAVLSVEDADFYRHNGINLKGMARAAYRNILSRRVVQGGSTLTQQLAKIVFTSGERTFVRKLVDTVAALELEKRYTKDEILALYLNLAYFGHGLYGVEAASRFYFDKSAFGLGIAESAALAGLLRSPNYYSPYRNPGLFKKRQRTALERMTVTGLISDLDISPMMEDFWSVYAGRFDREQFSTLPVRFNKSAYATDLVLRSFDLDGRNAEFSFDIRTTIDLDLQFCLQTNTDRFLTSRFASTDSIQAAAVLMEPATGEIRGLIGGREYSRKDQLNRAVQSRRQIGSLVKPFLYAAAIENDPGLTPETGVTDAPVRIRISRKQIWKPANYDGRYEGVIPLKDAIRESKNSVAVRLLRDLGVDKFARTIRDIWGTNAFKGSTPGLSLALGSLELSACQVAEGFSVFAENGIRPDPRVVLSVVTNVTVVSQELVPLPAVSVITGNSSDPASAAVSNTAPEGWSLFFLQDPEIPDTPSTTVTVGTDRPAVIPTASTQAAIAEDAATNESVPFSSPVQKAVFSIPTCGTITEMLKGVGRPGGTAWEAAKMTGVTNGVACKTGTTSNQHDAWFAVFSSDYVLVIWLGYDKGNKNLVSGGPGLAAPLGLTIWRALTQPGVPPVIPAGE